MGLGQTLNPAAARLPATRSSKRLLALRGDHHLVARVLAGDEAAFEVVYDRYSAVLLSFCRHMLGRPDEAEDAVQQVFVSAHEGLCRGDGAIELKPWLYAIARNRCLSVLRSRRELPSTPAEPSTVGLHQEVQGRADLRELLVDLADLPENQRAALLLTELEDLSHAAAASVLDCEPTHVKGLVFRARAGLIERRDARITPCGEIREELSTARRGTLRKGRLRHHLKGCPGCAAYLEEVRCQRRMMAFVLPVIPATGLKSGVLAAIGIGTGAGGAGGLTLAGGSALTTAAVKVVVAGALATGAGVIGHQALHVHGHQATDRHSAEKAALAPVALPRGLRTPAPTRSSQPPARQLRALRLAGAAHPPDQARATDPPSHLRLGLRRAGQDKSRRLRGAAPSGFVAPSPRSRGKRRFPRPVTHGDHSNTTRPRAPSTGRRALGSPAPAGPKKAGKTK